MPKRLRVCSLQYFIRPIETLQQFQAQVEALVETASDYGCRLQVFPEYFSTQLLTLNDVKRPIEKQVRDLAARLPEFIEFMSGLAKKYDLYIVAGTFPTMDEKTGKMHNDSYLFAPSGEYGVQGKMHMTKWEVIDWKVEPREKLKIFETEFGRLAIAICYDVEFPEIVRAAARNDAHIIVVPSCTDDRQGFLRVRYCAHARAIENQVYVIHSSTVGSLPMVPAISLNYGQASVLTPCDFSFARDGILAEGMPNLETMVIADLDMETIAESREFGSVLPLNDSKRTAALVANPEVVEFEKL
ncbi:carbon-nitrogen hydrolase family protein [bacterium]|nr:carbon-nitrogen hydrolase family protein [bacterium]